MAQVTNCVKAIFEKEPATTGITIQLNTLKNQLLSYSLSHQKRQKSPEKSIYGTIFPTTFQSTHQSIFGELNIAGFNGDLMTRV